MSVIELRSLSKWYGEVIGLNNVSASIGSGITGLVGPNGAGKSTLMGLVMAQLRPSQGAIRVFGQNPWDNPKVLSRIGYCPEGDPFWSNLTGRQFVEFLARVSGLSRVEAQEAAGEAIERAGMTTQQDRAIKTYSKGMRQRIKIAQALPHKPKLLILDEPFTGTDPVGRRELADLLRELAADGTDILVSSHVLHEVEALTQRILMIAHGRIVAEGDLRSVRAGLHDRPHAILVRVDEPRRLAADVALMEEVRGVRIDPPDRLIVETASPEQVYDRLPELILRHDATAREIAAVDEDLEAVFGYLTARR